MKKQIFSLFVAAIFAVSIFGQQTSPTPATDEQVVKISTDLIQIDVTVTDKDGHVVTGLTPDDFEIFENGDKQSISNFSFVSKIAGGATVAGGNATQGQPAAVAPTAPLQRGSVARTVAIVVDDLNLSFPSIVFTRRALKKFVDEQMQPGDLVAIIRTGGGVGALQQFTSDKRLLYAAIDKLRWNPLGSGGFDSLASVGQKPEEVTERFNTESDLVAARGASSTDPQRKSILLRENVSDKKRTDYEVSSNAKGQEEGIYAQTSIGTMRYIISGMNELPGRKMMMLFSDGIEIGNESNKSRSSSTYSYLQSLVDFANRSSVVVYTFDTKGLRSMSIAASDNTYEIIDGHRGQKERERLDRFKESQDGLVYFAHQTGGKALLNSDDLNGGIQRALDEQVGYYLLAYQPGADSFDPEKRKFNKLEVKVRRPGLSVSYRSGFFSSAAAPAPAATAPTAERSLAKTLMSPFVSNDIAVSVNALYANDASDGPYIRSFLHIDAKSLQFTEDAEGWKKASFDVAAVTFGDNGMPVENIDSKYTIKTKGATYDAMLKNGFVYVLIMPVKKPGVYQYRVALRDAGTGKIGSASQIVEIPDLGKQKLTMSSLAVEDVSMNTWQNITQGKVGSKPGQMQVASTLLYDTVLKQFSAGSVLRYGFEVYNAKTEGGQPKLEWQARIMQNDKAVVEGNIIKYDQATQPASSVQRISGAILLKDALPAGDYVLQMNVRDAGSKQTAMQLFPFEIIK